MELKITIDATPMLLAALKPFAGMLCSLSTPTQHTRMSTINQPPEAIGTTVAAPTMSIPQPLPPMQVTPPAPVVVAPVMPVPIAPAVTVKPTVPAAPPSPKPAPAAVPSTYTPEQINAACKPLMDAGRLGELRDILNKEFGVTSLKQMDAEQLTKYAQRVRELGALL